MNISLHFYKIPLFELFSLILGMLSLLPVLFRTDLILVRLNDLTSKESILKTTVRDLDHRLEVIESRQVSFHFILDLNFDSTAVLRTGHNIGSIFRNN